MAEGSSASAPWLPGSPPSKGAESRSIIAAMVVFAVAVVLLLSVVLSGLFGHGSSPPAGGVTFAGAEAVAAPITFEPGWSLEMAIGYALNVSVAETLDFAGTGCTLTPLSGPLPSALTYPVFHGDLLRGDASTWRLAYLSPTTDSWLGVYVINGAIALDFKLSGTQCLAVTTAYGTIPGPVVDSSVAVRAAAAAGGSAFLSNHTTNASMEMTLEVPPVPIAPTQALTGPVWYITFFWCSSTLGGPGQTLDVSVDATTGAVVSINGPTGGCPEGP